MSKLDKFIAPAVADDNIAAHYSLHTEGRIWRRVASAFPDLLEWLADAPPDDVVDLRVLLGKLLAKQVHERGASGGRIGYADYIVKQDRAAVVRFLVLCDAQMRRAFFDLLDSVAAVDGTYVPYDERQTPDLPRGYDRKAAFGDQLFALRGDSMVNLDVLNAVNTFDHDPKIDPSEARAGTPVHGEDHPTPQRGSRRTPNALSPNAQARFRNILDAAFGSGTNGPNGGSPLEACCATATCLPAPPGIAEDGAGGDDGTGASPPRLRLEETRGVQEIKLSD